jgi:DNA-binding CsgD family transcriptional regulator
MSLGGGYLTGRELSIWKLRRDGLKQADIAKRLGVQRQGINHALQGIDSKMGQALQMAAVLNKLDVWGVNIEEGLMEAYSQAHKVPVIVSFSEANGVQAWYLYEGKCDACNRSIQCRSMLVAEAEERGVKLSDEDRRLSPTKLARKIFAKYSKIVNA